MVKNSEFVTKDDLIAAKDGETEKRHALRNEIQASMTRIYEKIDSVSEELANISRQNAVLETELRSLIESMKSLDSKYAKKETEEKVSSVVKYMWTFLVITAMTLLSIIWNARDKIL